MNIFTLEEFYEGELCTFYTVRWDEAELSETDKFFSKYENNDQTKRPIQELAKFIEIVIGAEQGAKKDFFRFENIAHGLPPTGKYLVEEIYINYADFPLRLYCLWLNESLVILFNGAEKTSLNAKDGKTSMTFTEANQFAKRILEAINNKEIHIASNAREIKNSDESLEIYL